MSRKSNPKRRAPKGPAQSRSKPKQGSARIVSEGGESDVTATSSSTNPADTALGNIDLTKAAEASNGNQRVAIEVKDLTKTFRIKSEPDAATLKELILTSRKASKHQKEAETFKALKDINFEVKEGETFGILGHNGSGKSTLLKIIAGTMRPNSGKVRVRGKLAALLELGAGFHPDLTGRENVYLNGAILGFPKSYVDSIFDEIVDFSEIGDFIDLQVRFYSSGMAARLGFSVATNLNPDVLLIDEVLAVGDEAFQLKCMERVHNFRSMGRTMLIVSHGPEKVRELCSRLIVLKRGELLHVGDVEEGIDIYRDALHSSNYSRSKATTLAKNEAADEAAVAKKFDSKSEGKNTKSETAPIASADQQDPTQIALRDSFVVGARPADGRIFIEPGDSVDVVIRYEVIQPTPFRLRLTVRTPDNSLMINRSTTDVPDCPDLVESGKGELMFSLKQIPLLDGLYQISAVAESPDGRLLFHRTAKVGEIAVKGPGARFGRVNPRVACSIPSGDEQRKRKPSKPASMKDAVLKTS